MEMKSRGDGTSFDVVDKLREALGATELRVASVDSQEVQMQCAALVESARALIQEVRKQAPSVEQLKGLSGGLRLAVPMIEQHKELWKDRLPDTGDLERLKQSIDVVHKCKLSVLDAAAKQREEQIRESGRFEGCSNAATSTILRIGKLIDNYDRITVAGSTPDANDPHAVDEPHVDEPPRGGNSVSSKASKKAPTKKSTRKKKATTKRR